MEKLLFTSESVTEGHPDKMCDQWRLEVPGWSRVSPTHSEEKGRRG